MTKEREAARTVPRAGALAAAVALAAAMAAWAAWLWRELLVARAGGEPTCLLGGTGCGDLWDGAFAGAVQQWTGLPVAAWGAVFGLVAAALPALAWRRSARRRDVEPLWSASLWVAAAGVASVAVLLLAGFAAGAFCSSCAVTYALVLAYAGVLFAEARRARPARARAGAGVAVGATLAVFGALLYPGLATPRAASSGSDALAATTGQDAERKLAAVIARLSAQERQMLANARATWLASRPVPGPSPRPLRGPSSAPVRITTFTDSACAHCAQFHDALEELMAHVPEGSVAVESRVFPLDGSCNPLAGDASHPERCAAARARLCVAGRPGADGFDAKLYAHRAQLSETLIQGLAAPMLEREALRACMSAPETEARLREDVQLALAHGIEGTPLVLVNERRTAAFIPFLYAMAVTGGDANHPAFQDLPPPRLEETR